MKLESVFEDSKKWIENSSKELVLGTLTNNSSIVISFDAQDSSLEKFLEFGCKSGVQNFIVSKFLFDKSNIVDKVNFEEIPESNKKKIERQVKILDKYDGKIELLIYSFIVNSVVYEFGVEWECGHEILDIEIIISENSEDELTRQLRIRKENVLSDKKVNELALILAEKENFFKSRSAHEKLNSLLLDVIEAKGINEDKVGRYDKSRIIAKAKALFDRKFLKEKEAELINQIDELKNKGLSKVAIKSKLGITEGTLNKYYYK